MFAALAMAALAAFAPANDQLPVVSLLDGGTAGANGVPRLVIQGAPIVGGPFGLRLERGRPGAFGVAACAATDAPLPLPEFGAIVHPSAPYFAVLPFVVDADGRSATLIGAAALAPALCGVTFAAQAFVVDDAALGGLAFSSGRRVTLGVDPKRRLFAHEFITAPHERALLSSADFDGDGRRDVAFVEYVTNSFGVYLSRADGWLADASLTPLGATPGRHTTADFDGDGERDFAVLLPGGQAAVALGRGDGTFEPPIVHRAGALVLDIAAGDFDGDGAIDLVTANGAIESISLLLGNGDGTFGLPFHQAVGHEVTRLVVADVTGDGHLDVVMRTASSSLLVILRGEGDGTFDLPTTLTASSSQGDLHTLDLDLDGRLDLLTSSGSATLNVWKGLVGGGLGPRIDFNVGGNFVIFAIEDVDGDGQVDLIGSGSGQLKVLRGLGDTVFVPLQNTDLVLGSQSSAVGDFNDDGELDIVLAPASSASTDENVLIHGIGGGWFDSTTSSTSLANPSDMRSGDFDGDDLDDVIVIAVGANPSIHVQRNLGGGVFAAPVALAGTLGGTDVEVVDFDRDGALDVVATDRTGDLVRIVFGDGHGGFAPPLLVAVDEEPWDVEVGDVNGDGLNDLVTRNGDDDLSIFLALGPRTLGPEAKLALGTSSIGLELADVDGDGVLDVFTIADQLQGLVRRLGNGDGTFGPAVPYPTYPSPERLLSADMDGDGDIDIVVEHALGCGVQRNDGDGDFFAQPLIPRTSGALWPVLADIDGDGDVDIVGCVASLSGNSTWGAVWIARNTGTGSFAPVHRHVASHEPWAVAVGDFDGDTLPDIVALNGDEDTLHALFDRRAP